MLKVFACEPAHAPFIEAGVVAHLGDTAGVSCFPAMPHGMLTLRLDARTGHIRTDGAPGFAAAFHSIFTEPSAFSHTEPITAVGVLIKPAAAACLLGRAGGVAANRVWDWGIFAGPNELDRLVDEVCAARSDATRVQAVASSFCRVLGAARPTQHAWHTTLCDAVGQHGVQAGQLLGLGPRQLERRCQTVLGVAPKTFQRLVRFRHTMGQAMQVQAPLLADVAMAGGYYDQSHLARDAKVLAGVSVSRLLDQARPTSPWWSLAAGRELHLPSRHHR